MSINDNPALENEADVMGKKAAEGKNVNVSGVGSGVQKKEGENDDHKLSDNSEDDKKSEPSKEQENYGELIIVNGKYWQNRISCAIKEW